MKAIIEIDIPDYQIGQEVSIYFKDTMMIKGVVQEPKVEHWIENLCDSCTNKACEFQSGILRSKCDFYIAPMPHLEPDNCGNYIVQKEPKTGHWIGDNQAFYIYAKCSECGSVHDTATNYCPECGCLMDRTEFDEYVKTEGV